MSRWITIATWKDLNLELVRPIVLQTVHEAGVVDHHDMSIINRGDAIWWFLRWTTIPPFPNIAASYQTKKNWEKHRILPVMLMFDPGTKTMQILVGGNEQLPLPIDKGIRDAIVWVLYDLLGFRTDQVTGLYSLDPRIPDEYIKDATLPNVIEVKRNPNTIQQLQWVRAYLNKLGHLHYDQDVSTPHEFNHRMSFNLDAMPFIVHLTRPAGEIGPWITTLYRTARVDQIGNEPLAPTPQQEQQHIELARSTQGLGHALELAGLAVSADRYDRWIDKHSLGPDSTLPVLATFEALGVSQWQWPVLLPQEQFEDYVESLKAGS
jgi:hypothetical protein